MGIDSRILGSAAVNINNNLLYITGGYDFAGQLNSTEIHSVESEPKLGPELPFATSDHCFTQIDTDKFMLIGYDRNVEKNRYFIYDISTNQWQPELEDGPKGVEWTQQYCQAFKIAGKMKVFRSGYAYHSYIFDVTSKKWDRGEYSSVLGGFF